MDKVTEKDLLDLGFDDSDTYGYYLRDTEVMKPIHGGYEYTLDIFYYKVSIKEKKGKYLIYWYVNIMVDGVKLGKL